MKSLEIFSGAGGLAKGLELAGFNHAGFIEFNKHACASLNANFEQDKVFCGDIKNFDFTAFDDIDIVAGGPPCQPFSLGGKHAADQDDRDMFPYAINAIDSLQPKAFIFENVKGLLRSSFSDYFAYIILRLTFPECKPKWNVDWRYHLKELKKMRFETYQDVKYRVVYKLLNATDYGVPQYRERVVIIGVRSDINKVWEFPNPTHSEERLLWEKFVTGEYWDRHNIAKDDQENPATCLRERIGRLRNQLSFFDSVEPKLKPWKTVKDALADVPDPQQPHSIEDHTFRDGARSYSGHTGSDIFFPAKTIKAGGHGVPGGENMIRFPDGSIRYLTVFEAKRIQTFPDDFRVLGAWGEAMRQIGNAVPVLLAKQLGDAIHSLLYSPSSAPINNTYSPIEPTSFIGS